MEKPRPILEQVKLYHAEAANAQMGRKIDVFGRPGIAIPRFAPVS
jgi:hypothetical protein